MKSSLNHKHVDIYDKTQVGKSLFLNKVKKIIITLEYANKNGGATKSKCKAENSPELGYAIPPSKDFMTFGHLVCLLTII